MCCCGTRVKASSQRNVQWDTSSAAVSDSFSNKRPACLLTTGYNSSNIFVCLLPSPAGRWYIREGWLKMVPTKGAEAKPKMFFLFSDMLLQAKRCSTLHPTSADKFSGQHAYPLQDCTVEKVFGHTRSKGGLLSVSVNEPAHTFLSEESSCSKRDPRSPARHFFMSHVCFLTFFMHVLFSFVFISIKTLIL